MTYSTIVAGETVVLDNQYEQIPASRLMVTPTGGAPQRLSDALNAGSSPAAVGAALGVTLPTGADRTGASNADGAFAAALANAVAAGTVTAVTSGAYALGGTVQPAVNQGVELTGTRFSGAGVLAGTVNWAIWAASVVKGWVKTTNAAGTEATTVTTMQVASTGASASYQKSAAYSVIGTADPSAYSGFGNAWTITASRDACGYTADAYALPGNMTASICGANARAFFQSGADGAGGAAEFDVQNNSGNQALLDQPTSKLGVNVVAYGNFPSTAAVLVSSNGQTWHDGVVVRQAAVQGYAFRVLATGSLTLNTFGVTPLGDVTANSIGNANGMAARVNVPPNAVNRLVLNGAATGGVATLGVEGDAGAALLVQAAGPLYLGSGAGVVACNAPLYGGQGTFSGSLTGQTGISIGTAGPTWTTGIGAPTTATPVASLYSRSDGAAGSTLYVSRGGGTWAAVAGV